MNNEFYWLEAIYQTHSNSALCIQLDDKDYWFPLVSIKLDVDLSNFKRDDSIQFEAQAWILIENDLEWMVEE